MRTVKELSQLTGISIRTLHYYDEIGLLAPTSKSKAGYRLYDNHALETLQQILFFREFDIPLKEIKTIITNPDFDKIQILQMQRNMLESKKKRIQRLIDSIDNILKGENQMNFEVFTKIELGELCQTTIDRMPEFMRESIIKEFGSIEQWRKHYIERCSKTDMQQGYKKVIEWYGDKDSALKAMNCPPSREVGVAFAKKIEAIEAKLYEKKEYPIDSDEIKQLVEEYGFIMKEFSQVKYESGLMLSIASNYREEQIRQRIDEKYNAGTADYFASAIENFYTRDSITGT